MGGVGGLARGTRGGSPGWGNQLETSKMSNLTLFSDILFHFPVSPFFNLSWSEQSRPFSFKISSALNKSANFWLYAMCNPCFWWPAFTLIRCACQNENNLKRFGREQTAILCCACGWTTCRCAKMFILRFWGKQKIWRAVTVGKSLGEIIKD